MHVDSHAVALSMTSHIRRHDDEGIFAHKVANASFPPYVARRSMQVELEGLRCAGEEEKAADVLQQRSRSCRHGSNEDERRQRVNQPGRVGVLLVSVRRQWGRSPCQRRIERKAPGQCVEGFACWLV